MKNHLTDFLYHRFTRICPPICILPSYADFALLFSLDNYMYFESIIILPRQILNWIAIKQKKNFCPPFADVALLFALCPPISYFALLFSLYRQLHVLKNSSYVTLNSETNFRVFAIKEVLPSFKFPDCALLFLILPSYVFSLYNTDMQLHEF